MEAIQNNKAEEALEYLNILQEFRIRMCEKPPPRHRNLRRYANKELQGRGHERQGNFTAYSFFENKPEALPVHVGRTTLLILF